MESKQYVLSPDLSQRLAAIDIGSNSIRLIIAEGLRDGRYRVLDDEKETTRLGKNLSSSGRLDPRAVEQSLDSLRRMKQIAQGYQVQNLRAIATCAVREAVDGKEFCRRAKAELDLEIEVVSGKQEAELAFHSVARNFNLAEKNVAVADIGGGSTEIILAADSVIEETYTTALGAVRLSELYGGGLSMTSEGFEEMVRAIDTVLRKRTKKPLFLPHLLIGTGGTFTALATIVMASKGQNDQPVRGYQVTRAQVRHVLDRLRKMSPKARRGVQGLSPDRADIIVAGITIIDRVMRRFQVNLLQVHSGGVRDGLLLTMVDQSRGAPHEPPLDREAAIDRFAARCGTDIVHGRHVALLAGSIFAQLAEPFALNPRDRSLVEAAARLQDVGYLIDYEQHHKHSYHLILNSGLAGFEPRELELIANIARYHRGANPKSKHANYSQLAQTDQERVRQLAAILRLAGGFDRSHTQQVKSVRLVPAEIGLKMQAASDEFPEVDIWGARRRAELFQKVYKTPLVIEWQPPDSAKGAAGPVRRQSAGGGNGKRHAAKSNSPRASARHHGK